MSGLPEASWGVVPSCLSLVIFCRISLYILYIHTSFPLPLPRCFLSLVSHLVRCLLCFSFVFSFSWRCPFLLHHHHLRHHHRRRRDHHRHHRHHRSIIIVVVIIIVIVIVVFANDRRLFVPWLSGCLCILYPAPGTLPLANGFACSLTMAHPGGDFWPAGRCTLLL